MPTRRDAFRTLVSSAALPALAPAAKPRIEEYDLGNIKLSHRMPIRSMNDEDLLFLQQIGVRWARIEFGNSADAATIKATQERLAKFGMKIYSAVHYAYRELDVQLGRGRRDELIETYCTFLKDCGQLGIPVANYDWHPANTYTTAEIMTPRRYKARQFKLSDFRSKIEKQAFDREYSADDIWATYTYFMKAVLPVAEKANVKLALHPDDPPVAKMNGVAKVFVHYDGYKRAVRFNDSPANGMCFCRGSFASMGDHDIPALIRRFGKRIHYVHFRDVEGPCRGFARRFTTRAKPTWPPASAPTATSEDSPVNGPSATVFRLTDWS